MKATQKSKTPVYELKSPNLSKVHAY